MGRFKHTEQCEQLKLTPDGESLLKRNTRYKIEQSIDGSLFRVLLAREEMITGTEQQIIDWLDYTGKAE